MSMIARFVQVAPDLLTRVVGDPSLAPAMLEINGAVENGSAADDDPGGSARRMRLLESAMSRLNPAARQVLTKNLESLGVSLAGGGEGAQGLARVAAPYRAERSQSHPAEPVLAGVGPALSLEKAWHGVHYLLCGEAEAGSSFLSQAVLGGTEFGDDLGYGPARYFALAKVSLTANELSRAGLEAEMKARFDPAGMSRAGIYPRLWTPADLDWLMAEFRRLRGFFADASANQFAMVTCIV